jgi:prevent-host-death family protein
MAERYTPISKARAKLPRLSKTAQDRQDRHIITQKGQPQSVLLGYEDYKTMRAAVDLLRRPDVMDDIRAGLKELDEGKRYTFAEARKLVRAKRLESEASEFALKLAARAGVDVRSAERVVGVVFKKIKADYEQTGVITIPGVGHIEVMPARSKAKKPKSASKGTRTQELLKAGKILVAGFPQPLKGS